MLTILIILFMIWIQWELSKRDKKIRSINDEIYKLKKERSDKYENYIPY